MHDRAASMLNEVYELLRAADHESGGNAIDPLGETYAGAQRHRDTYAHNKLGRHAGRYSAGKDAQDHVTAVRRRHRAKHVITDVMSAEPGQTGEFHGSATKRASRSDFGGVGQVISSMRMGVQGLVSSVISTLGSLCSHGTPSFPRHTADEEDEEEEVVE